MTREEKLKAIKEEIATKTEITFKMCSFCDCILRKADFLTGGEVKTFLECDQCNSSYYEGDTLRKKTETNYSPVMIGDVLDWIEKKFLDEDGKASSDEFDEMHFTASDLFSIWTNKRLPIDDEGNKEAVDQVYHLILELGTN